MTLIDDRGRLFGRLNLVDAGVVVLAIVAAAGLLVAYRVFRLPLGPAVNSVAPATQAAVNGARIELHGRDFLPFLRVFVRRSGNAGLVHDIARPADAFTLANQTQATWVVESPVLAEVRLPDGMSSGTYDLVFANETRQLSIAPAAFTLTALPSSLVQTATAIVRLEGAFTQVTPADVPRLAPGARVTSGRADESVEILAVSPSQPDLVPVAAGRGAVPAAVDGRVRVPASLRVHCTVAESRCLLGGAALAPGDAVRVHVGAQEVRYVVDELVPDFADADAEADLTVRFVLPPAEAALMKPGDLDAPDASSAARGPRTSAVLASIASRSTLTGRALETVDQQPHWVEEPEVRLDAVLRVPVTRLDGVAFYKGQALKGGGTIAFETLTYKARAWVLAVSVHARAKGRSSE